LRIEGASAAICIKEAILRLRSFNPQLAIDHLRFLLFGLAFPLAGVDFAPFPLAGDLPPGAAADFVDWSLTPPVEGVGVGAFKLVASGGLAGIGIEVMVGSST
jgi:hypothetical protein